MKISRAGAGLLVAVAVMSLLGGCFLLPEAESQPAATSATPEVELSAVDLVNQQVASLHDLDGITASFEADETGRDDVTYAYLFTIGSRNATTRDLVKAVTSTWKMFLDPIFENQLVYLEVDGGERGRIELDKFDEDWFLISRAQLGAELDYWLAMGDVLGAPVQLRIHPNPDHDGYVRWHTTTLRVDHDDFEAFAALPVVADGATDEVFVFDSLTSTNRLPTLEAFDLATRLFDEVPANSALTTIGVQSGSFPSGDPYVVVDVVYLTSDYGALETYEDWPVVLEVVKVLAAPVDPSVVSILRVQPLRAAGDGMAAVTIGQCPAEPHAGRFDIALFELISGEELPEGSEAGSCPVR